MFNSIIKSVNMPKHASRANNRQWKNGWSGEETFRYYYEHDDRIPDNTRRVSFMSKNRISKNFRKRDNDALHRLNDEDVDMTGGSSATTKSGRFTPYTGKGAPGTSRSRDGTRAGPRSSRGGRHAHSTSGFGQQGGDSVKWFRVSMPYGGNYPKEYILKTLVNEVYPQVLIPLAYRINEKESSFYTDDPKVASALSGATKKITMNDGFKLILKVAPSIPRVSIDNNFKEKIKEAMRNRYNPETKALDLTKFHSDPSLARDALVPLFHPSMLSAAMDIICENIPEIVGLNLNENQLFNLVPMITLIKRAPNLTVLHLGRNRLRDIYKLDCLKGLKLVELNLDGNPLCNKYSEEGAYVSAVRKIFPKVLRLDGQDLPPPINFDVAEEVKLPAYRASFMCSPEGQEVARQFLQQYYTIYDSDNRKPLIDAYGEKAMFSLTVSVPKGENGHKLHAYLSENRNLLTQKNHARRLKLLNCGKAAVVSKLEELPATRHDLTSFTVDLSRFTPELMLLSITGLFVEPKLQNVPVRFFSRFFAIVPMGSGFVIVNDLLHITNATERQAKLAFAAKPEPLPAPPVVPLASPVVSPIVSPVSIPSVPTVQTLPVPAAVPTPEKLQEQMREEMVIALSRQTNMNFAFSRKCLEDNRWEFQAALGVFTQLFSENKVPPEAFAAC